MLEGISVYRCLLLVTARSVFRLFVCFLFGARATLSALALSAKGYKGLPSVLPLFFSFFLSFPMFSFLVISTRIDCSTHLLVPIELVRLASSYCFPFRERPLIIIMCKGSTTYMKYTTYFCICMQKTKIRTCGLAPTTVRLRQAVDRNPHG